MRPVDLAARIGFIQKNLPPRASLRSLSEIEQLGGRAPADAEVAAEAVSDASGVLRRITRCTLAFEPDEFACQGVHLGGSKRFAKTVFRRLGTKKVRRIQNSYRNLREPEAPQGFEPPPAGNENAGTSHDRRVQQSRFGDAPGERLDIAEIMSDAIRRP